MPVIRISDELFREVQKHAEPLVDNFESALRKALGKNKRISPATPATISSAEFHVDDKHIPPNDFWRPILEVLMNNGGRSARKQVHDALRVRMQRLLKPGDYEKNRDGTYKWEKQVDYQRLAMVHEGLIQRGSQTGVWEISELGKKWLSNH